MSSLYYPEPYTQATLSSARRELVSQRNCVKELTEKIQGAEQELALIVEERTRAIQDLKKEREEAEERVTQTLAYISPIRRLPHELLRQVFLLNFEDYPCCAWVLAAVCSLWRRLVLCMPTLWSKIRLVTTQNASADTIRLWLERSGSTIPLDIEIFLHTPPSAQSIESQSSHRRRTSSTSTLLVADGWGAGAGGWDTWTVPAPPPPAIGAGAGNPATYMHLVHGGAIQIVPIGGAAAAQVMVSTTNGLVPATLAQSHYDQMPPLVSSDRPAGQPSKSRHSYHWGYIAFFYLAEQIHRWERFVFRFDKHFNSMHSLKSIGGDAPLLREFEVSCAEPGFYGEWTWLPCAKPTSVYDLGQLKSLTLQYVPFKWSSPILRNLRSLTLRTLPTVHIALDRILYIISSNPHLETLNIHFASANPAVLPLAPTTMYDLKILSIGGHYLLSNLVDSLVLPVLDTFVCDIDARDPVEEMLAALLSRSNNPPLSRLSLAYGLQNGSGSSMYYGTGAVVTSWNFLSELENLQSLQVGGTPFEPLLVILGPPEDDGTQDRWVCPQLTSLAMRGCHAHGDGVSKLVQMVVSRNPDTATGDTPLTAGGVAPVKLKHLELHDCATLGVDVIRWLKDRIEEVLCTEPVYESSPRSPSFQYL